MGENPLRVFALTPQFLQQRLAGAALYTSGPQQVAPDASPGWTVVLMERAPRGLGERHGGRTDRQGWQNALRLWCHVMEPTGERMLRPEGERREGSRGLELGSQARRPGTRGRPTKTWPPGVTGRRTHHGSHRPQRGLQRPTSPAPSPAHPDTAQPLATKDRHAHHLEAFPPSRSRRCAASCRRTNREAKATGRRPER